MRARISGGGACGPHKPGWRGQGGARTPRACDPLVWPPDRLFVPVFFKYSIKNHTRFSQRSENFYFQGTFLPDAKTENREN